jgi:NAD(P)-dependent dehydrogenase (short-subunit alcohol dehydrogenase family)
MRVGAFASMPSARGSSSCRCLLGCSAATSRPRHAPRRRNRWGRYALPEEVAAAVVRLCSDAASYVSGLAMPSLAAGQAGFRAV